MDRSIGKKDGMQVFCRATLVTTLALSNPLESRTGVAQWLDTFESAIDYVISSGSLIPRTSLETSLAAASGSRLEVKLAWPPLGDSPSLDVSRQWELHDFSISREQ